MFAFILFLSYSGLGTSEYSVCFVFSAVSNTKMAPEWFVVIQSFCLCKQIWRLAAKVYVSSKYVSTLKRINNINFNCVDVL